MTELGPVLGASAGLLAGIPLWRWLRAGSYRRVDDEPRSSLQHAWVVVVMTTAAGGLAGACQGWLAVAAWLYLVGGAAVTWVDLDVHRVPDRVLAAWAPVLAGSLILAAVTTGDRGILGGATMGAVVLGGLFLVLALVGSMGLGDAKLAAVTGLPLGAMGWGILTTALFACFAAAAVAGGWLLIRGVSRRAHLAFGPAIVVGGAAAVIRFGLGW